MLRYFYPLLLTTLLFLSSCLSGPEEHLPVPPAADNDPIADILSKAPQSISILSNMGFSVQVGAFRNLDNAVFLEKSLSRQGLDAYYFRHTSALYKVRFGNYSSSLLAHQEAEKLYARGVIGRYFIVSPEDYPAARIQHGGQGNLRSELVQTAQRFLGVPYRWGGEDRSHGFDCSGLTMVSYRLNGLNLPRNSRAQFKAGRYVAKGNLQPGDLVFFATKGGKRVTHVGMYIGHGKFIHAPRTGKTVRIASLSSRFFKRTYVGGRTYL